MFVELHIIQNFSPACLNRDDTNTPKDCVFGGYRRARISSQCIKRSIRQYFREQKLLPDTNLAVRTKRIVDKITDMLKEKEKDRQENLARSVVVTALGGVKIAVADDQEEQSETKTQYLLFLSDSEIKGIADICDEHWDELSVIADRASTESEDDKDVEKTKRKKTKKDKKKEAKAQVPKEVVKALEGTLAGTNGKDPVGTKAVDLALFGRMLADLPAKNVEAACQVAHAISTNEVSMEMDFYTAVDDLKPEDTAGADMMGVVEFNSSCFYRYAVIDTDQLNKNLDKDAELTKAAVNAFLKAAVHAIPTGKQSSMAAHNPPAYVRVVVKQEGGPWNLANAFLRPIRPRRGASDNLAQLSVEALEDHHNSLGKMYGVEKHTLDATSGVHLEKAPTVPELIDKVVGEVVKALGEVK